MPQVWGRPVYTVFFGGGTPSLLSARGLDDLLSAIRARLPLAPDAEITLEANPGTFEARKFAEFRALGINRLSIGIQSFNAAHLKALGRIHDAAQARAAIEIAQASFDNFNLDLMYALPGQSGGPGLGRHRGGDRVFARACFRLSPDHRAEHAVPPPSAQGA